jgi:hypothetical protein
MKKVIVNILCDTPVLFIMYYFSRSLKFLKLLREQGYWLVIRRSRNIRDVVEQTKGYPLLEM